MDLAIKIQPLIALFFALAFMVIYSIYGKWWLTSIGRHMMGFMGGCALVLCIALLVRFFPSLDNMRAIRFWSWNVVIALFAWRFWVAAQVWLFRNQSDLKRIRGDEDAEIRRHRRAEDSTLQSARDEEDAA